MSNPFLDQGIFMKNCDQTVDQFNPAQYKLYCDLITEEVGELSDAILAEDTVEQLDALIDILVVTIGALHSLGVDAEGAWREVIRSNNSKLDPVSGKVIKREDGKVLKPSTYSPPELAGYVNRI